MLCPGPFDDLSDPAHLVWKKAVRNIDEDKPAGIEIKPSIKPSLARGLHIFALASAISRPTPKKDISVLQPA